MRAKARVDANQNEIVAEYRALGFSVAITSSLGKGFPDIVVGKYGYSSLVEIKNGELPPSKRRLTADEQDFFNGWKGDIRVVNNIEDVHLHHDELKESFYK